MFTLPTRIITNVFHKSTAGNRIIIIMEIPFRNVNNILQIVLLMEFIAYQSPIVNIMVNRFVKILLILMVICASGILFLSLILIDVKNVYSLAKIIILHYVTTHRQP